MISCNQQRCSSSWSAEITGHNEYLMTQIIVNLPVKSILRFRSVSKQWNSLLTHPAFIQHYDSSHTRRRNPMLFFQRNSDTHSFDSLYQFKGHNQYHNDLHLADFGYLQIPSGYTFFSGQPCNGLLLFIFLNRLVETKKWSFYVCNPSTRKYCELALPYYIVIPEGLPIAQLAFDPCSSPYYKVIFFWKKDKFSDDHRFSIYSSETKIWRKLDNIFEGFDVLELRSFFSGPTIEAILLGFTLTLTKSINIKKLLPGPPNSDPTKNMKQYYFGGDGGHLHLILGDKDIDQVVDVYELSKDYSGWVAKYKVDFYAIGKEYFSGRNINSVEEGLYYSYSSILCVLESEEEASVVVQFGTQLMAYNCIDKTAKKLYDMPFPPRNDMGGLRWYKVFQCTESLSHV